MFEAKHQWDQAVTDFSKAAALTKGCPVDALKGRAACYVEQHKFAEALSDLNTLIGEMESAKLRLARAVCLEKLGRTEDARKDRLFARSMQTMSVDLPAEQ